MCLYIQVYLLIIINGPPNGVGRCDSSNVYHEIELFLFLRRCARVEWSTGSSWAVGGRERASKVAFMAPCREIERERDRERERERERDREREKEREREREIERERESKSVCVCVCVCVRERESAQTRCRSCVHVYVYCRQPHLDPTVLNREF